jgi:hypothetical protein
MRSPPFIPPPPDACRSIEAAMVGPLPGGANAASPEQPARANVTSAAITTAAIFRT